MKGARFLCLWPLLVLLLIACSSNDDATTDDNGDNDNNHQNIPSGTDPNDNNGSDSDTNRNPDTSANPNNNNNNAHGDSDADTGTTPIDSDSMVIDTGSVNEGDPDIALAPLLQPFDANKEDLSAIDDWGPRYGKTPEIIAAAHGSELHVLAQDYDSGTEWNAVLLHIKFNGERYQITQAITGFPMLDRVMGLDVDDEGNRYYATGVAEDSRVDPTYPPLDTWREDIVRVIKLSPQGEVLFNIDVDTARHDQNNKAEPIINPMVAATSRLAVGGGIVGLVHGINTGPDASINGTRHQKALSTQLDAQTGAITLTAAGWCSHSFDQRLLYDGTGITEYHLGDAYPRYVVFSRNSRNYPAFHIKGAEGANETHTRLGNVALIENDPTYRYLALFVTEHNADSSQTVNGARNVAITRLSGNNNSVDDSMPDTLTVSSSGQSQTNHLRWLTHYTDESRQHAERPKLVSLGDDTYAVLWEAWTQSTSSGYNRRHTFNGVYAMVIDAQGETIKPAQLLTDAHHLHRGDDAFALPGRAGWITGSSENRALYIHIVDASLNYQLYTIN
ncbi:MAG: hypothetical protein M0R76_03200 [Proteobacteria bacterium]|nr:hypothetical protein [Pseudomonadota bacterium]